MVHVSDYWVCIGVSIWTIVQTFVHVWWILQGRKLFSCHYKIEQKLELFLYYTYLYSNDCDDSPIKDYVVSKEDINVTFTNTTEEVYSFQLFFQRDVAVYPFYQKQPALTNKLMLCNVIIDAFWFVASVSLLVGTIFKLKERSAVIFLCPWIVVDVMVLILDLFGAVYFGLQIRNPRVGLNLDQIKLESIEVPNSAAMAIVSGRLGVIWVINCFLLVFVIRATLRASKRRYADERSKRKKLNTSAEARIKNWQQFYGVIDDGNGKGIEDMKETERNDHHVTYACTFRDFKEQENLSSTLRSSSDSLHGNGIEDLKEERNDHHVTYACTFRDFKEQKNLSSTLKSSRDSLQRTPSASGILRGQLPWSYTQNVVGNTTPIVEEQVSRF